MAGVATLVLTIQLGCDSESIEPDNKAPALTIAFPTSSSYDRDSDGLVDFEITWSDDSQIDSASFSVRPLTGVNGPLDGGDVLPGWRISSKTANGIVFEETLANLLHGGTNRIEFTVADSRGNTVSDTLQLELPHGALIDSIPTGVAPTGSSHARGVTVCPDRRVYATVGRYIVVADADSLKLIGAFPDPFNMDQLNLPFCVGGDSVLYVTYLNGRFDRANLRWLPEITPLALTFGIAQSATDPNLIYVGEADGYIGIIDRARATRIASVNLPRDSVDPDERFFDLATLPNRNKLYATRLIDGGLIAVDPTTGAVIATIPLEQPELGVLARSDAIEPSHDGGVLYVALLDAVPRGLLELDTNTDRPLRRLALDDAVPQELALSPSGRRIFVTTQDRTSIPSANVLVDVQTFRVIQEFPRPRAAGALRIDGGVAFHPNGKLIFVGRDMTIDVYLNRE
jgi:DNA-binding beta-propeller fold protein YncE